MSSVTWGPPPPRVSVYWIDKLQPFVERPGEWGQLDGDFDRRTLGDLRRRRQTLPKGDWEFDYRAVRGTNGRRIQIWARYLGPEGCGAATDG